MAFTEAQPHSVHLTGLEREVLAELAHGRSNREIAKSFVLSEKTVKTHVSAILSKLGVQGRTQAALHAVRTGLLDGPTRPRPNPSSCREGRLTCTQRG